MRGRIHAFGVALQRALGDATRVEALDNNAAVWAHVWMAMARQTNGATGRGTAACAAAAPSTSSSSLPPRRRVPEHHLQNLGHVNPLAMVPRVSRGAAPQPEHATQPRLLEAAPRESSTTQHPPQGSTALVTSDTSTVDNSQPKLHQALHTIEVHPSCHRHVSDCSLAHRPCTTTIAQSQSTALSAATQSAADLEAELNKNRLNMEVARMRGAVGKAALYGIGACPCLHTWLYDCVQLLRRPLSYAMLHARLRRLPRLKLQS